MRPCAVLLLASACVCGGGAVPDDGGMRPNDAGPSLFDAGPPIDADAGEWAFVQFPNTTCGNGSPAAIGVNLVPGATQLFVYFEGGGACWSDLTCNTLMTAANLTIDYTEQIFDDDVAALMGSGLVGRDGGVFANASWVYVPYCTGDLHAGTTTQQYDAGITTHHTGGTNVDAFLSRLISTVPGVTQIWLTGSSAGGYGATFNLDRFHAAFPAAHVDLLQDSSPFIETTLWPTWQSAWAPVLPCTSCSGLGDIFQTYEHEFPTARIALLSNDHDAVVSAFFSITTDQFNTELGTLIDAGFSGTNDSTFIVPGVSHVLLYSFTTTPGLETFVDDWARGP